MPHYTSFQRRVLQAVADLRDPRNADVAGRLRAPVSNTTRSLHLLHDRGEIAGSRPSGPWHLTAKGRRRLQDWGSGL